MFLHLSVILFTGGVSTSVHAGIHTPPGQATPPGSTHTPQEAYPLPRKHTPPESTPQKHPPGKHTPQEAHPPEPHPRWSLQRMVRILLECFLV